MGKSQEAEPGAAAPSANPPGRCSIFEFLLDGYPPVRLDRGKCLFLYRVKSLFLERRSSSSKICKTSKSVEFVLLVKLLIVSETFLSGILLDHGDVD